MQSGSKSPETEKERGKKIKSCQFKKTYQRGASGWRFWHTLRCNPSQPPWCNAALSIGREAKQGSKEQVTEAAHFGLFPSIADPRACFFLLKPYSPIFSCSHPGLALSSALTGAIPLHQSCPAHAEMCSKERLPGCSFTGSFCTMFFPHPLFQLSPVLFDSLA